MPLNDREREIEYRVVDCKDDVAYADLLALALAYRAEVKELEAQVAELEAELGE